MSISEEAGESGIIGNYCRITIRKKWLNFQKEDWDVSILRIKLKSGLR